MEETTMLVFEHLLENFQQEDQQGYHMEGSTGPSPCGLSKTKPLESFSERCTRVSAAASAACECCGEPCNSEVLEYGAYENKLRSIQQTVRHVKDNHPEFLQTEKGKAWRAQMTVIIRRMVARIDELRQVHFDEDVDCKQDRLQRKSANRKLLQEYVQGKVKEELQRKTKKDEFCSGHCTYSTGSGHCHDRVKIQRQELTQEQECAAFMRKHGFDRNRAEERRLGSQSIVDKAWVHKHFPKDKADADAEDKTTITDNVSANVNKMPMAPPDQAKLNDRLLMLDEKKLKSVKEEVLEDGIEPVTKRQKIELRLKQLDEEELELDKDLEQIGADCQLTLTKSKSVSHPQLDGAAAVAGGAAA